jgi:beta-lactamase class D
MIRPTFLLAILAACGGGATTAAPRAPRVAPAPELEPCFRAAGVDGAMVVRDSAREEIQCYGGALCQTRFLPASTFKIPNSIIGLETGVVSGPEFGLRWDGTERRIAAWNRDHTLATAIASSVVWYYQEVARRIGEARMRAWVDRLGYGNRDMGGGIDRFWLDGALRISPSEQVEFLRRFERGELPISARTAGVVRHIIELERGDDWVLRGKTGWIIRTEEEVLWLVGWVERARDRRIYFATLLVQPAEGVDRIEARLEVTRCGLQVLGAITVP